MGMGPAVAVIGGGIIGMSIAWRSVQAGATVTVFDAGRIGNEASWAGAGMLAPGGEYDAESVWAEFALESLSAYPRFIEELLEESGVAIDYRVCGAFTVALSPGEATELQAKITKQSQLGIYSEQFPPSRIPGLRSDVISAQYYPDDAMVNPRDVMRALRIACVRAGVTLREFTRLDEVPGEPFDRVVIAAGAWSSQIRARFQGEPPRQTKAFPVRGHLIAFEEHAGLCDAIVRHGSTYLLRRAGNLVIAGASTEHVGFDRTLDGAAAAGIAEQAGMLIPELRERRYMTWNGFRPGSESGDPVLGRLADSNVWLAYGHYRNGILLAPATADRIAREVTASDFMPASLQTDSLSPAARRL